MKKKILTILFLFVISCAPSKPSWEYKKAPDTLFEAVNVKDDPKVTKVDKGLMKFLTFSTVVWILHVLTTR
tara:strand:- start:236 stop:448 length:213 start_codon:yes stop_codon:yes gene_type:complete